MAKQRYIKDSFRNDPYIQELSSTEKLLFLYLLTNNNVNIAGIYEITEKQMSFESGIQKDRLLQAVDKLSKDGKIFYKNNRIVIINFIKNQSMNPSVKKGIERVISELPDWIKDSLGTDCIQTGTYFTLLNFTLLNSTENREGDIFIEEKKKEIKEKIFYGKFVNLTKQEYENLIKDFSEKIIEDKIEDVNNYCGSKGVKYKDFNLTIRSRLKRDGVKKRENKEVVPAVETDDFFNSLQKELGCD